MGYRIGSFNIRDFSKSSVYVTKQGESKKDLSVIADIIRENHYDIVAIQEIDHKEALRELLEKISFQYAELNYGDSFRYRNYSPDGVYSANSRTAESFGYRTKHWEGRWARPKSDYGNNVAEGYGFIWNRDRIRLADNRDNEPFEPRIADFGNVNELVRPPYIGRFRPINARYEFRLINTHIAYGNPIDNSQGIIGEKDDDIIKMSDSEYRKKEFNNLIETVYADYCTQIFDKTRNDRNSRGLVPYTFLLGDYNLNMSSSEGKSSARLEKSDEGFIVRSNAALRVVTVNDRLTTLRGKPRSPEKEAELRADPIEKDHLANNYDHFSYDINTLIDHDIADPEIGVIMAFRKYEGKETSTESKYDLYRNKVSDHPLIQHKITMLRDKNTGTAEFRAIASEIAMLLGYEALKDLETEDVEVETPLEKTMSPVIAGKNQVVVPILRAGLGMTDGVLKLLPTAKVGHVGMMRDEETHVAHTYYCKFPDQLDERIIIVTDPMLATGGSASDAIDLIKKNGGKHIKFMCIVATMTGIEKLHIAHPDVPIYVGHVDRELNENAYILPGLGDAGDRIFGTKGI